MVHSLRSTADACSLSDERRLGTLEIREAKRNLSPDELAEISGLRTSLKHLGVDVSKKDPAEILVRD